MLSALGDLGRRVICQAIIPGMEPGITAKHGIVLVAPFVIFLRELVQRRDLAGCYDLARAYTRRLFCDQRLVGYVRRSWCGLSLNRHSCGRDQSHAEEKRARPHAADFILACLMRKLKRARETVAPESNTGACL